MPPKDIVQPRRGTAAEWAAKTPSPVLKLGELGVETDTHRMKIGDGVTAWSSLGYIAGTFDLENVPVQVARDTTANLTALTDPFLSGQIVLDTDTGATKIGDGESLWGDLPDLRKQFKNVVTVCKDGVKGDADFICSKYDSDDECIQAALNSLNGNETINISPGTYNINPISITGKSIYIDATGATFQNISSSEPMFIFSGELVLTTTLSADSAINTKTITLTDITGVLVGDIISLYNNIQWCPLDYPDLLTGESYLITAISSNTVTLDRGLVRAYTLSDIATAKIYHAPTVYLNGGTFLNLSSSDAHIGVKFQFCKNSIIKDSFFQKNGTAAVQLQRCVNIKIDNCNIRNSNRDGYGYGVSIYDACANILVNNCDIRECRHTVMSGNTANYGVNRDIIIRDNVLYGSELSATIDAHPSTLNYIVHDNEIHQSGTNAAFNDGTLISNFYNNTIYNGTAITKRGSIQNSEKYVYNNIIFNGSFSYMNSTSGQLDQNIKTFYIHNNIILPYVSVSGAQRYGIYLGYTKIDKLIFSNNYILGPNMGVYILVSSANSSIIDISSNYIDSANRTGINISYEALSSNNQLKIRKNSIINCNVLNTEGYGIYITNIQNALISNNIIDDTSHNRGGGIYTDSNSHSNTVINNVITGMTGLKINLGGTSNIIKDNPGYTTENTGTATITASQTSVTISHSLASTPTRINVTPFGNVGSCWVDPASITATEMTIHSSTAPETDTVVSWSAQVV